MISPAVKPDTTATTAINETATSASKYNWIVEAKRNSDHLPQSVIFIHGCARSRLHPQGTSRVPKGLSEIERHQRANKHDHEEGVGILETARNARRLFDNDTQRKNADCSILWFRTRRGRTMSGRRPCANSLPLLQKWQSSPGALEPTKGGTRQVIVVGWGTRIHRSKTQ